jgi:hypothetical protein
MDFPGPKKSDVAWRQQYDRLGTLNKTEPRHRSYFHFLFQKKTCIYNVKVRLLARNI